MGTFYIDDGIEKLIRECAARESRSEQQRTAAENTGLSVAKALTEMGLEQSILPQVRAEVRGLQAELRADTQMALKAKEVLGNIRSPEVLDERAKMAVSLTAALIDTYVKGLQPESSPGFRGTSEVLTAQTKTQIVRASSYIVWAVLTGGNAPIPSEESGEAEA